MKADLQLGAWCLWAALSLPPDVPSQQAVASPPKRPIEGTARHGGPEGQLKLVPLVELVPTGRGGTLDLDQALTRDGRGWTYLVTVSDPAQIAVFNPQGRQTGTVGRAGAGPGELRRVHHLAVGPGDTLFAWDLGNRRISVFAPAPANRFVRAVSLVVSMQSGGFFVTSDGRFVINGDNANINSIGLPLHLFGKDGTYLSSFGAGKGVYRRSDPHALPRLPSPSREGVWTLRENSYSIERWTLAGRPEMGFTREVDWFRPYAVNNITPAEPPKPIPVGIQEQADGRLLTLILVPDRRWREGLATRKGPHGSGTVIEDYDKVFDTRLELLDPNRPGSALATLTVDRVLRRFAGPAVVSTFAVTGDGEVKLRLERVVIAGNP